ncbi:hypothetical protein SCOR_05685 [Sulfidibacter corallicola]
MHLIMDFELLHKENNNLFIGLITGLLKEYLKTIMEKFKNRNS